MSIGTPYRSSIKLSQRKLCKDTKEPIMIDLSLANKYKIENNLFNRVGGGGSWEP
jgi:hypothetical protein